MLFLKCTGNVQKTIGLRKDNLADAPATSAPLGDWYVNSFEADRRTIYIFMSEPTLLSFILFQGKRPVTVQSLPLMMLGGLQQLLTMRGLAGVAVDAALAPYETGLYARTNSRSALGSLNDLVHCYRDTIEGQGGLAACDLTGIIMSVNSMPQRKLEWRTSWESAQARLALPRDADG